MKRPVGRPRKDAPQDTPKKLIKHGFLTETEVWECPNGHWSRVEFTLHEGPGVAKCSVCKADMKLCTKILPSLRRRAFHDDFGHYYNKEGIDSYVKDK